MRLWKVAFTNYYRADVYFGHFVHADTTWNVAAEDWGFDNEPATSQLKRTKAQLKSDCSMFLETLASYLPCDYLVEKITRTTTSMAGVWELIDQFYGIQLTSETFLALAKLTKKPTESHRQFYLRIEGFVSKHLSKAGVKVEDVTVPQGGDTLTVSLKNVLCIWWMEKIHDKLIDCVKLDYAQELREGKELVALMPRIADNIPSILARHDIAGGVNKVSLEEDTPDDDMQVNKVTRGGYQGGARGGQRGGGRGGRQSRPQNNGKGACAHCNYLSETLRLKINSHHDPQDCFRKDIAVRLIAWDRESSFETASDIDGIPPENKINNVSSNQSSLQIEESPMAPESGCEHEHSENSLSSVHPSTFSDQPLEVQEALVLQVQKGLLWSEGQPVSARSPALMVTLCGHEVMATLDEGAEINCLDKKIAVSRRLKLKPSTKTARAADSSQLRVVGQLQEPLILHTVDQGVSIRLDHVVVVENLNAQLLIGEPGKASNFIHTIPHEKMIIIRSGNQDIKIPYISSRGPRSHVARVTGKVTVAPGESLFWNVPEQFSEYPVLQVNPRPQDQHWFSPRDYQVRNKTIAFKNILKIPVTLKRNQVFGEIRMVDLIDCDQLQPVDTGQENNSTDEGQEEYEEIDCTDLIKKATDDNKPVEEVARVFTSYPDQNQYVNGMAKKTEPKDYTDLIQLDPDNILTPDQKVKFRKLCQEFKDIIRPEPGRYNGAAGYVDNSINFSSKPPPNKKIYQQKLTDEMKAKLGEKLDQLMEWGVLVYPEKVGVRVEFVCPSKILPKSDPNEFRAITDFTPLNKYVIKPQGVAPTIQEAKDALAKAKYHCHLDLSNWFYQSGMAREDMQYLGTLHPTKGILTYAAEPQGLTGSPEHAYEKLARIYHDMLASNRLTRMADGLHVLS